MNKEEIKEALIAKIKEKYERTTDSKPEIDEDTVPFQELEYFDSLLGSEVGIDLEVELGWDFQKIKKAFEKADLEGITIEEMAEVILEAKGV